MIDSFTATPEVPETWDAKKEKLKWRFSFLKDADLNFEEGRRDEMLDRVQVKLGKTRKQLEEFITTL